MTSAFRNGHRYLGSWIRRGLVILVLLAAVPARLPVARAYPFNPLPYQPGFEDGKVLEGMAAWYASPTMADLNRDGKLEIIFGGRDGMVYAVEANGDLLWQFDSEAALNNVALKAGETAVESAPAIGDLDGDGWFEVVVSLCATGRHNGGMVVLSHDGKLVAGWPQLSLDHERDGYTDGIYSSPALGDLDGDGDLEIVAGSWDMDIYAWHHDGRLVEGWPRFAFDTVWSSPALADLDRDGRLEIIIGSDAHDPDGGVLHAFRVDGSELAGFPQHIDQTIYSSPAVADLDGDGWLDIVVGTGNFFAGTGHALYAWDHNGELLPGWPAATGGYVLSAPTVGDIDGDGRLEVVAGCNDGRVYAFRGNGAAVSGWPVLAQDNLGNTGPLNFSSPVLANFDADPSPEVFINHFCDTLVIDGNGSLLTHVGNSASSGKPSMYMFYAWCLGTTPAVGDIDGDGRLEIARAGGNGQRSPTGGDALLYVWKSGLTSSSAPWPMYRRDAQHQALFQPILSNDARVVSHTLPFIMAPGEVRHVQVTLQNIGTRTWTAASGFRLGSAESEPFGATMRVPLASGESVAPGQQKVFAFDLRAPVSPGYYTTEWRMLQGNATWFGLSAFRRIKVGDEPALYVLQRWEASGAGGVHPVGLAESLSLPPGYTNWPAVKSFAFLQGFGGYHLLDYQGGVWQGGAAQSIGGHGLVSAAQEILLRRDGTSYYILDRYGRLTSSFGADAISSLPVFGEPVVRSAALTPDQRGVYFLTGDGLVYTGGKAPRLSPATPSFDADVAKRIKLTADGKGYYVLDAYGRVWNGGSAPAISPNYDFHMNEDWARDFELTFDQQGYYLLDKEGKIYTGGAALAPTMNLSPIYEGQDIAVDLVVADSRATSGFSSSVPAVEFLMLANKTRPVAVTLTAPRGPVNWTASVDQAWLSLSHTSGATPADLVVTVNTAHMGLGIHRAQVVVTPAGVSDGPVTIPVLIRVLSHLHPVGLPLLTP